MSTVNDVEGIVHVVISLHTKKTSFAVMCGQKITDQAEVGTSACERCKKKLKFKEK
jgi:hypothetical protein